MSKKQRSVDDFLAELDGSATRGEVFPPVFGYVYAVTNPIWPGLVKIGQTFSLKRRWGAYQTSDPYRAYRMLGWSDLLADPWKHEKALHERLESVRVPTSREWFRITDATALALINGLRKQPMAVAPAMPAEDSGTEWSEERMQAWMDDLPG